MNKKMYTGPVTKEWLRDRLKTDTAAVIGAALLAIYNNQTTEEKQATTTRFKNGVGFSGPDARTGSIGARMFAANKTVAPWVVAIWSKVTKTGYPRICKYADQLETIARNNRTRQISSCGVRDGGVSYAMSQDYQGDFFR